MSASKIEKFCEKHETRLTKWDGPTFTAVYCKACALESASEGLRAAP